jgi:hypothetical protein
MLHINGCGFPVDNLMGLNKINYIKYKNYKYIIWRGKLFSPVRKQCFRAILGL